MYHSSKNQEIDIIEIRSVILKRIGVHTDNSYMSIFSIKLSQLNSKYLIFRYFEFWRERKITIDYSNYYNPCPVRALTILPEN